MSNEQNNNDLDFGDGLDLGEVDVEVSGEFKEGFNFAQDNNFIFDSDIFEGEDVDSILESSGTLENILLQSKEQALMLEFDETDITIDLDNDVTTEPKYEVAISAANHVLALYSHQEDESYLIEQSNKEISDSLYKVALFQNEAHRKILEYINSPIFRLLPPPSVRFMSERYKKDQDFRSLLMSLVTNYINIEDFTLEQIIYKIFDAYKEENLPDLSQAHEDELRAAITKLTEYAEMVYKEASRKFQMVQYKPQEKKLAVPETVGNHTYVCSCGAEYPMENGRPTMTFLIRNISDSSAVTFMNPTVYCDTCNHYLALPHALATELSNKMYEEVRTMRITLEEVRIYRPSIQKLMEMIPKDIHSLFQLEAEVGVTVVDQKAATSNNAFVIYNNLVKLWMEEVTAKEELEITIKELRANETRSTLFTALARTNFSSLPDLEVYQFLKTLVHYLEGFSRFPLTTKSYVHYEYLRREEIDSKPFSVEFTNEFLEKNIAHLASLKNLYTADTTFEPLYIRKEFFLAINKIIAFRLLSDPANLAPGSGLATWLKKPHTSKANESLPYGGSFIVNQDRIVDSPRLLVPTKKVYEPVNWNSVYFFIKNVMADNIAQIDEDDLHWIDLVKQQSEEEFAQMIVPEKLMFKPSYRIDEFQTLLLKYGYLLFQGAIVDPIKQNIAIGLLYKNQIDLTSKARNSKALDKSLNLNDLPVTKLSDFLLIKEDHLEESIDKMLLLKYLSTSNLPDEMETDRADYGVQKLINDFEDYQELLLSDENFIKKYGDIECSL